MINAFTRATNNFIALCRLVIAFVAFLLLCYVAYCVVMWIGLAYDHAAKHWFEEKLGLGFIVTAAIAFALACGLSFIRRRRRPAPIPREGEIVQVPTIERIFEHEDEL